MEGRTGGTGAELALGSEQARTGRTTELDTHPIQELGLDVEPAGEEWRGEALLPDGACAPGTRFPLASVLVLYADMIAGAQVREKTLPQMSVTVDLCLDVIAPEPVGHRVEEMALRSRFLRAGKRISVTETSFLLPGGTPLAMCTGTFSAISSTHNVLEGMAPRHRSRHDRPLLAVPFADRVGMRRPAPGVTELDLASGMGNSTGSLMGGFTALLAEMAALSAAEAASGVPHLADRLHIRYLAPVRVGSARASVRFAGGSPDHLLQLLEVRDTGQPDVVAADVSVGCVPLR